MLKQGHGSRLSGHGKASFLCARVLRRGRQRIDGVPSGYRSESDFEQFRKQQHTDLDLDTNAEGEAMI